jgi:uncharacterized protein
MSKITDQLEADLKQAMIARDKELVSTLKGLKSSLQYATVDLGPGVELSEDQAMKILQKESKKRSDAADIYIKAGDSERTQKEQYEKKIIDAYLPELLSRDEVMKLVEEAVAENGGATQQNMGKIIAGVREKSGGLAEGSLIAQLVKEKINK